jgi:hypothetical protein
MVVYMIIAGGIVSLVLLAVIVRFALSPQTDAPVKRAAVIALGAIGLAVLVCLALILTWSGGEETAAEDVIPGLFPAEPSAASGLDGVYLLVAGCILLLFIGLILFLSLREKKKTAGPAGRAKKSF